MAKMLSAFRVCVYAYAHVHVQGIPEGLRRLLLGLEDVSVRRGCFLGGVIELRFAGLL